MITQMKKIVFSGSKLNFEKLKSKIEDYYLSNSIDGNNINYFALVNGKKVCKKLFLKPLYKPEFYGINIFNKIDGLIIDFLHRIGFCFSEDKGTGKTNLAFSIAKKFQLDLIEIDPSHEFNFDSISFSNCVILLDDLKILTSRAVAG